MVFNKVAKDTILEATQDATVVSYDWWCYKVVTGNGGRVIYNAEPRLKYLQDARNLIRANTSWRSRLLRAGGLLRGRFCEWNGINLAALSAQKHLLTNTIQRMLENFILVWYASLLKRFMLFKRSSIYRQTLFGNFGLLLCVLLSKV